MGHIIDTCKTSKEARQNRKQKSLNGKADIDGTFHYTFCNYTFCLKCDTRDIKAVDTIGNCQRLAFTVCVSQRMHKITNL